MCISKVGMKVKGNFVKRWKFYALSRKTFPTYLLSQKYEDATYLVRNTKMHKQQSSGINIYEMGQKLFMFEFSSKLEAENVVRGDWHRKKHELNLQWWLPTVFKEIGDLCGGWIQTEEETELRNHLKWARLMVRGDGDEVPTVVKVESEGIVSEIQIWCEAPVKISIGAARRERTTDQRVIEGTHSTE
uniref:DUF4283 domain-containing protein n=1 Tax=Solanum tuberosum TaxID=4113 RepID=M1DWR2_SOLTU